jgi:hypothetical protein
MHKRHVLCRNHFRKIPTERPESSRQINRCFERVNLVHAEKKLVLDTSQHLSEYTQRLARRSRLLGIKEEAHNVGSWKKQKKEEEKLTHRAKPVHKPLANVQKRIVPFFPSASQNFQRKTKAKTTQPTCQSFRGSPQESRFSLTRLQHNNNNHHQSIPASCPGPFSSSNAE